MTVFEFDRYRLGLRTTDLWRTSLTRGNGAVTSYGYDNVSRLTQIVQNPSGTSYDLTLDFTRDPAGAIASTARSNDAYAWTGHYAVNRSYTTNGLNQYTASGSISPTYDSRGNLQSAGSSNWYSYTSDNLLYSAWNQATLSYDPAGRMHQEAGASVTRMLWDGDTLIAEYDNGNALQRRYVFGPGTDEPLVRYEGTGTSDRHWYHADERGSVIATSDGSGAVTNVNSYDEYGIPGSGNVGRFQYTGQQWLSDIGMYYYRARLYSPTLGRFAQTDPIGSAGGMNLYAYVGNNPVNFTDPAGLCRQATFGLVKTTDWGPVKNGESVVLASWPELIGCDSPGIPGTPGYSLASMTNGSGNSRNSRNCPSIREYNAHHQAEVRAFIAEVSARGYRTFENVSFVVYDPVRNRWARAVADVVAVPPPDPERALPVEVNLLYDVVEIKTGDANLSVNQDLVYNSLLAMPVGRNAALAGFDMTRPILMSGQTQIVRRPGLCR